MRKGDAIIVVGIGSSFAHLLFEDFNPLIFFKGYIKKFMEIAQFLLIII